MGTILRHWTERLFVDPASLFQSDLEAKFDEAVGQVEGLHALFSEHGVPEGSWVLDLACGVGRHSVLLGEKGYRVLGFDISPTYIARAREIAEERDVSDLVEFREGDMRRVAEVLDGFEGRFGAVINMFTSMGLYDKETDLSILSQLNELTAPGGLLVIDIVNRDALIRRFQPKAFFNYSDGRFQLAERKLDLETSRMHNVWTWYRRDGEDLKHIETFDVDHRVYSLHELKGLVVDVGWEFVGGYSGFGWEPLITDSFRMIVVGKKP